MNQVDNDRYGRTPRWKTLALGLPWALALILAGGYLTLASWGVIGGDASGSRTLGAVGPILAGFGVALGYVCLRPRRQAP